MVDEEALRSPPADRLLRVKGLGVVTGTSFLELVLSSDGLETMAVDMATESF